MRNIILLLIILGGFSASGTAQSKKMVIGSLQSYLSTVLETNINSFSQLKLKSAAGRKFLIGYVSSKSELLPLAQEYKLVEGKIVPVGTAMICRSQDCGECKLTGWSSPDNLHCECAKSEKGMKGCDMEVTKKL